MQSYDTNANSAMLLVLQTGLTPSASGSAYLELEQTPSTQSLATSAKSALKLTCTVHGPRPLPRSAPFTPSMLLSTHVKFTPFASRQRRGYLRDAAERDLAVHLDTALRGVIMTEQWPKSGLDVVITILEEDGDNWWGDVGTGQVSFGMMSVLAGCITAASTAVIDAGIDCMDILSGGVAAIVPDSKSENQDPATATKALRQIVLDPCPSEHPDVIAACVVGYLKTRDEVTEIWTKSRLPLLSQPGSNDQTEVEQLVEGATRAAAAVQTAMAEILQNPPNQQC